jgi:hypothetical protein
MLLLGVGHGARNEGDQAEAAADSSVRGPPLASLFKNISVIVQGIRLPRSIEKLFAPLSCAPSPTSFGAND